MAVLICFLAEHSPLMAFIIAFITLASISVTKIIMRMYSSVWVTIQMGILDLTLTFLCLILILKEFSFVSEGASKVFGHIFIWAYLGVILVMLAVSVSEMIFKTVALIKKARNHSQEENRENKIANLEKTSSAMRTATRSMIISTNSDLTPSKNLVKVEQETHEARKIWANEKDES